MLELLFYRESFDTAARVRTISMAASGDTVPSIVVYVTVPNKESGFSFAQFLKFLV